MGVVRFILAVSVVLIHSEANGFLIVDAWDAVPLFYIISGFYMSMILNGKYNSYYTFISNRFLKLFPSYLVVLLIGAIASREMYLRVLAEPEWNFLERSFFVLSNICLFGTELFTILTKTSEGLGFIGLHQQQDFGFLHLLVIGPAWSLSVELTFYLLAPFLLKKTRKSVAMLCAFFAVGLSYDLFLWMEGAPRIPWGYNLFPASIKFFCGGALSYRIFLLYSSWKKDASRAWATKAVESCSWFFLLTLFLCYQYVPTLYLGNLAVPRFWLACALLVALLGPCFLWTKNSRIDQFFGDISYPVYISHFLFTYHIKLPVHPMIPTFLLSTLLLFGIGIPMNKIRQSRVTVKAKTPAPVGETSTEEQAKLVA